MARATDLWHAYKLIWKRRRLRWRAFRSRHVLRKIVDRTAALRPGDIPAFCVTRNEMVRLPFFLDHHRALGVAHFLIVDNDSTDGSADYLRDQPDVSLWTTPASYRDARFGLDWVNWLLMRHGRGRWCLVLDADELLVYAGHETHSLKDLTHWLDARRQEAFGALMLDLYPQGSFDADKMPDSPLEHLQWFDAGPYRTRRQRPLQNLWVQGGVRDRVFFQGDPQRAPTLNKLPLIRWGRRHAFVNSTHSVLPARLNHCYDGPGGQCPSGVLLHTKFLPDVRARAREDQTRQQHFSVPGRYADYYQALVADPDLWHPDSKRYTGWQQLEQLGLMTSGGFADARETTVSEPATKPQDT